jgi:hypothetical protein
MRIEWRNPDNQAVVHYDPYGHYYGPNNPENLGPHYGVDFPDGRKLHYTYPSGHDPATNR